MWVRDRVARGVARARHPRCRAPYDAMPYAAALRGRWGAVPGRRARPGLVLWGVRRRLGQPSQNRVVVAPPVVVVGGRRRSSSLSSSSSSVHRPSCVEAPQPQRSAANGG